LQVRGELTGLRRLTYRRLRCCAVEIEFSGEVWFWRGPAPWHFVTVPDEQSDHIASVALDVTYGWGMIPVTVRVGRTEWKTSLWPKDERYILPLRTDVRRAEAIELGDTVAVTLLLKLL
jgi:Domain of unknown function (DUF1905)